MEPEEKLKKALGKKFDFLFRNAVFHEKSIEFFSSFQAQQAEQKCSTELVLSFGFMPEIIIKQTEIARPLPAVREKMEIEPSKATPIEIARAPKTAFAAREMVLLNLPHSKPKKPAWIRKNGNRSLIVQGGYRSHPKTGKLDYVGIPYGPKARLILFFLMTEALRKNCRRVHIGQSFNAFLEAIGTAKDKGGKDSGRGSVKEQLLRIVYASFALQDTFEDEENETFAIAKGDFVKSASLWFSKKNNDQLSLFDNYIDISEELFKSLKKAPVPLDWEILLKLGKSPLAIDLYAWLSFESAKAQHCGHGRFVPWRALKEQMGAEYGEAKDFVKAAKRELSKIEKLYPEARFTLPKGGIKIEDDSLPSVPKSLALPEE